VRHSGRLSPRDHIPSSDHISLRIGLNSAYKEARRPHSWPSTCSSSGDRSTLYDFPETG
jgi:hypothetical protein